MIFTLLIVFQLKHFICDYPLQVYSKYMLGKFKQFPECVPPLTMHAGIQAVATFLIAMIFAPTYWWFGLVDFVAHFCIDRLKADKRLLGRWNHTSGHFWSAIGFDQMLHHLTHYIFIYFMVKHT